MALQEAAESKSADSKMIEGDYRSFVSAYLASRATEFAHENELRTFPPSSKVTFFRFD